MNYEEMSFEELKELAKERNIFVGNIKKPEKLIDKLKEYDTLNSLYEEDNDLVADEVIEPKETKTNKSENVLDSINEAIEELEDSSDEEVENIKDDTKIGMEEEIPCRSITYGGLTYVSKKTGAKYRWDQIGKLQYISMSELVNMNNNNKDFLVKPLIILQDMRAVNFFRLSQVYENVAQINNLKSIFNSLDMDRITSTLKLGINVNMRDVLVSKISQMIKNNVLNNIKIIKLCEKELRYDFSELITEN